METKRRAARSLVTRLRSDGDDQILAEVRCISRQDPEIRLPLADAGAIPLLLLHLSAAAGDSQANAAASLLNLSISCREALMATPGLLSALAAALRPPSPPATAQHAAATLFSLLSVESYRPIIGSKRQILSALLNLIESHESPPQSIKDAMTALFGISLYPMNRSAMVEMGVVAVLFERVVGDGRRGIVEDATAVIAQVAGCGESVEAFRKVEGARVLVGIVGAGSERARENAASALLNLAMSGGEEAVEDIAGVERAEEVVGELAERGSARAKSKAEPLLRVLSATRRDRRRRLGWDLDSPAAPPPSMVSF